MNLWKKFMDLFPKPPLVVGTIVSGSAPYWDVDFVAGGTQRVFAGSGSYAIGNKVYVQDSKIVGPAPSLTDVLVDL